MAHCDENLNTMACSPNPSKTLRTVKCKHCNDGLGHFHLLFHPVPHQGADVSTGRV